MDVNTVATIIKELGFPIVFCVALLYIIYNILINKFYPEITKLTISINEMKESVDRLSLLLTNKEKNE